MRSSERPDRSTGDCGTERSGLHVITRLDRGGSSDNTLMTCAGLADRGWRVGLAYGPTVDPSPLLEPVRARGDANLLPGYSADVEVLLSSREDVLRVPTQALIEGSRALVLADGVLEEREITRGTSNWEYVEVLDGLSQGELVVLSVDREGVEAGASAVRE